MNKGYFATKCLIAGLLLALFLVNLGQLGRSIPDEKRYYQSTREMISSGDYITPRYHGSLRFQKPILSYWAILLSYKAFGVNWFGARFPSAFTAMLTVMLVFSMATRFFGKRTAVFAALILASTELYYMYARFAAPDMLLIFFITLALFLFIEAYYRQASGERKAAGLCAIGFYAAVALGFLTKGPFGVVFPVIIPVIFLASNKELGLLKRAHVLPGAAVFIAIVAPWFIKMTLLHGNEYWGNIWSLEIVKRFQNLPVAGGASMIMRVIGAMAFYTGMLFLRFLPWAIFIPAAMGLRTTPSGLSTSAQERRVPFFKDPIHGFPQTYEKLISYDVIV